MNEPNRRSEARSQGESAGVRVGIVGATGLVGEVLIDVLQEREFPMSELRLLASSRSVGKTREVAGRTCEIVAAEPDALDGLDFVFFAATGSLSKDLAPEAVRRGAVVIDKSGTFRMDPTVPLVVPEVNGDALSRHAGVIACPNCTTIGLVMALAPLDQAARLRKVIVTTLQAVSGAGRDGLDELRAQIVEPDRAPSTFGARIAGNVVPHCGQADAQGHTDEERKIVEETRKILDRPDLHVSATCVRVPVEVGHAASVRVECEAPLDAKSARIALEGFAGVEVIDDLAAGVYPTPLDVRGRDSILVGRLRNDPVDDALWLFQVGDNLRKGAATNAVQIAECLLGSAP